MAQHPVPANAGFAAVQVGLGLAIAWRPTVRAALAASIVWALAVWWLGEGLGGVLAGSAGPLAGGPGAALLCGSFRSAVAAFHRRHRRHHGRPSFVAASRIGVSGARVLWIALWGSLAGLAVDGSNRSAQGVHDLVAGMVSGQPAWLAAVENNAAALAAHRGLGIAITLAITCASVAAGAFGPPRAMRAAVVVAALLGVLIWVIAEGFGALAGGQSTDPNTGPLLMRDRHRLLAAVIPGPTRSRGR